MLYEVITGTHVVRGGLDYISAAEFEAAMSEPMVSNLYGAAIELNAPYVAEMVRRDMLNRFGGDAYTAGYQVVTTLDSRSYNFV